MMSAGFSYQRLTKISTDYNHFSTEWQLTLHDFMKNQIDAASSSSVKGELYTKTIMCVLYGGITEASRVIQP
jgi:hypothetical protein